MDQIVGNIIHYNDVSSKELRKIILSFSRDFNLFPNFYLEVVDPQRALYQAWGRILLSSIPKDRLSLQDKYMLIVGLSFHGLMPATEINRLLILSAARRAYNGFQRDKLGALISIFSILFSFTRLIKESKWCMEILPVLRHMVDNYKKPRTKITKFILDYYKALITSKFEGILEEINKILLSKIPTYLKAKLFFEKIKQIEKTFEPWTYQNRLLKRMIVPISPDEGLMKNSEFSDKHKISLEDIEHLAEVDYNLARKIAMKIDKGKKASGKLPSYSENKNLLQKLLKERRFTAAVRRVRIRQILSILETMLLKENFTLMKYGYDQWFIGDEEEFLDIEASADSFGKVIPDLSTLKNVYEYGGQKFSSETIGHVEICIDTSGSMTGESLERAIDVGIALVEIAKKFEKTVALTTFSSGAWQGVPPTQNYDLVEEIILRLEADGGTNIRHVFNIINGHLSYISDKSLVIIITDTMIYDIDFPTVISNLEDILGRARVCIVALTNEIWWKTKKALANTGIDIIKIPPQETNEEKLEIIFDFAKKYFESRATHI